jgi:hypothetical protein
MMGEKLKPLVIGKSAKPRFFKNLDLKKLPVEWTSNSKAWMTGNIFENWLKQLNKNLAKKERKILLLLDNCTSHPKLELSHIKLLFIPPNTTSLIQPLDQGIIKAFKFKYRRYFLRHLISKLEANISNPLKYVTVLDAINWIQKSWNEVTELTIKNCFKHSGFKFFNEELAETSETEDFTEISTLIEHVKDKKLVTENECTYFYKLR